MATRQEIANFYHELMVSYPSAKLSADESGALLRVLARRIADVEGYLLPDLLDRCIDASPTWLPPIGEIMAHVGALRREQSISYQVNPMIAQLQELEDDYYQRGNYEADLFEQLAVLCERKGKIHTAAHVREKARRIEYLRAGRQLPLELVSSSA